MLDLEWKTERLAKMQECFNLSLQDSLYLTHYELHQSYPQFSAQEWKEFITEPSVSDYISSELRLLQNAELKKLMRDITKSDRAKSPGTAQIIATLSKNLDSAKAKDGPVFIVMTVPMTPEERSASNVQVLKTT